MDDSINGLNKPDVTTATNNKHTNNHSNNTPSTTTSFVNYDSHIRNNTLICNFIEYDNSLKDNDTVSGSTETDTKAEEHNNNNHDIDNEPNNNNNLRIRMMKQVLNNEDNAMYHFTKQDSLYEQEEGDEKEIKVNVSDNINIDDYSLEHLEEYKSFLKMTNDSLKQEYSDLDNEFNQLYIMKDRLLSIDINKSLKTTSLKEKLLNNLIQKLSHESESTADLIDLLSTLNTEIQKINSAKV